MSAALQDAGTIATRTVTVSELQRFAQAIGLLSAAPDRCSTVLIFELYCRTFLPIRPLNPAKVVAELKALEGIGPPVGTCAAAQFGDPALHGLWKKHYLENGVQSVAKNIMLGFGKKRRHLRHIIATHHNLDTAKLSPERKSADIAKAVINLYPERSSKLSLTGEWIVFAKHNDANYYLCFGTHDEVRRDPVEFYERVKRGCSGEFPFLF